MWHHGLFYKLHKGGIRGRLWLTLKKMYEGLSASVLWGDRHSSEFPVKQGVRQGGILSPLLYLVYIDGLIKKLRDRGLGLHTGSIYTGIIVLADDVALLASTAEELNLMLDVVHVYSTEWRYAINPSKSAIVVMGSSTSSTFRYGRDVIPQTESHPHLGIIRTACPSDPSARMISTGNRTMYAITGVGAHRSGLPPHISSILWEKFCIPRMLYGAEVMPLTKMAKLHLDRAQTQMFKSILGLPRTTATEAIHLFTGLLPISDSLHIQQLRLLGQLLLLSHSRFESRVFFHMLCHHPSTRYIASFSDLLEHYQLPPIQELLNSPIPYFSWKKTVKSTVTEHRHEKTASATSTKSTLNMMASLHPSETPHLLPRKTPFPHLRQAIPIKCQLLCGMYRTNQRLATLSNGSQSPACPCLTADETVNHLIGACPLYNDERENFIMSLSTRTQHQLQLVPSHLVAVVITNLILLGVNDDPPITAQALDYHAASLTFMLDMHIKRSVVNKAAPA